jgi:hypothetical protein
MYHGDADGKVEMCIPVREMEDVGYHCRMGLLLDCYFGQVFGSMAVVSMVYGLAQWVFHEEVLFCVEMRKTRK